MTDIHGYVEIGWESVRNAFEANFARGLESGAACAVYRSGRKVVDLWAGIADESGRPWCEDTAVVTFSVTKAATAICAHQLVERGELDLDALVTDYWPEFGQAGKADTTVRWLLSHQAGVPAIDGPLTIDDVCAWDPVIHAIEAQPALWQPGTRHRYHSLTYGFLVGEVIRRVTGRTVGRYFADEIARPLGLQSWIGSPKEVESRIGTIIKPPPPDDDVAPLAAVFERCGVLPHRALSAARTFTVILADPASLWSRAASVGGAFEDTVTSHNLPEVRAAELPGSNLVTDARSLARMFAATIGEVESVRLLSAEAVARASVVQTDITKPHGSPELGWLEHVFTMPMALGFMRPSAVNPFIGPNCFGHTGAAGALGFADPDSEIGFGYITNRAKATMDDRRSSDLCTAVAACLASFRTRAPDADSQPAWR